MPPKSTERKRQASVEIGVDIISLFISGQNGNSLISEEGLPATKTSTIGRYVFHPWILFIIQESRYILYNIFPGTILTEWFWRVLDQPSLQALVPILTQGACSSYNFHIQSPSHLTALYSFLPATLETWLWFLATWRDWTAEFATLGTEPSPGSDSRTSASSLSGDTLTPRTSGLTSFSVVFLTLNRFEGIHAKHSPDWQLALKNTRLTDSGALSENSQFVTESAGPYECQVSTSPHMAHVVHLRVRGDLTQPRNTLRPCDASGGRAWDVCWVLQHDQPDLPGRLDCKTSW